MNRRIHAFMPFVFGRAREKQDTSRVTLWKADFVVSHGANGCTVGR
jgi:hypothetical protein